MRDFDDAIAKARAASAKLKARHRLTEIVVGEVSLVDRAANQETFLVVKSFDGPRTIDVLAGLQNPMVRR